MLTKDNIMRGEKGMKINHIYITVGFNEVANVIQN